MERADMRSKHPEAELIPYLSGELTPPDRERVAGHLSACADCRQALAEVRRLLERLAGSAPQPPEIHWGRYRAELRAKLQRRGQRWRGWLTPVPLALAAGLAGIVLLLAQQGGVRQAGRLDDLTAFEETVIGSRLDFLRQYALLERMDLLEDLDLIRQLDRLSPTREG